MATWSWTAALDFILEVKQVTKISANADLSFFVVEMLPALDWLAPVFFCSAETFNGKRCGVKTPWRRMCSRYILTFINMKNISPRIFALAVTTLLLGLGNSPVLADSYGPYHPYAYGHNGYWDKHHGYHPWDRYHDHDGYWYRRGDGVRIFISI